MNELLIHQDILYKLKVFIINKKIPNIIFHGSTGSGKKFIVNKFIDMIYNYNSDIIKTYTIYVNCAHGKGIKFIREDLKFFAKTNININNGNFFKTIILLNADKLTIDAQSALRRCIELFSHSTRFFIIVEDKYKLLKPILSRFCELYISLPLINNKLINLHLYNLNKYLDFKTNKQKRDIYLYKLLNINITNYFDLVKFCEHLYNKAYNAFDIINYIEHKYINNKNKFKLLITFQKIKKEFRNEKICMLYLLNNIYFRYNTTLENISFM
jgi:DNA polymerase III delta prime subunit